MNRFPIILGPRRPAVATPPFGKDRIARHIAANFYPTPPEAVRALLSVEAFDGVLCWPDPDRSPPKHFLQHRYCWAVWEPGHRGPPAFWWLSAGEFRSTPPPS